MAKLSRMAVSAPTHSLTDTDLEIARLDCNGEAVSYFLKHLLGDEMGTTSTASGVLDLPPPEESDLLPHERKGMGIVSLRCVPDFQEKVLRTGSSRILQANGAACVLTAFAAVLRNLARGDDDVVVGLQGENRFLGSPELSTAVPFRIPLSSSCNSGCENSLASIATEVAELLSGPFAEHGPNLVDMGALRAKLGVDALGHSGTQHGLFQVLVAFGMRNGSPSAIADSGVALKLLVGTSEAHFAERHCLQLQLAYSRELVSASVADTILRHVCWVLEASKAPWHQPLEQLPLIRDDEKSKILQSWSIGPSESLAAFTIDDGGDLCVHELFEHRVQTDPFAPALVFDDLTSRHVLTYVAADGWATSLALRLQAVGVCNGNVVALLFERSCAMVIAIYATLKAGGCYCPLDPQWPRDRLGAVVSSAKAKAALCSRSLESSLCSVSDGSLAVFPVVEDDSALWLDAKTSTSVSLLRQGWRASSKDPCYVFFTSGSTGKPKGVVVEHRGLVHRIRWLQHDYDLCRGDYMLFKHAYTFGLSEWEVFWPLSYGAAVIACIPGGERDSAYIANLCYEYRVPVFVFVPSALQLFLEHLEQNDNGCPDSLARLVCDVARQIIACGEPLRPSLVHLAHRMLPNVRVDNVFGPTEGEMTRYVCPRGRPMRTTPVGRPIDGSVVYVLGPVGQPCGTLIPGELHFAGPCIAQGYLDEPALTSTKFVPDPFWYKGVAGARMYKTGDLVRWRSDGHLVFVGRADHQVKLRGFRIELGDIEAAVRAASTEGVPVRESVALVDASQGVGTERLVLHVGSGMGMATNRRTLERQVVTECANRLPAYMVPSLVVVHEVLPRNANGKVDRRSLNTPLARFEFNDASAQDESESAALSAVEEQVRTVWADVLHRSPSTIAVNANFFASLGGNSLLAGRVTAGLRKMFSLDVPGTALYKHATVARLASHLEDLCASMRPAIETLASADALMPKALESDEDELATYKLLCLQAFAVVLLSLADRFGPQAMVYGFILSVYYRYGFSMWLLISLPLATLVELASLSLLILGTKWIVVGRLRPGHYPLWGPTYFRWWLSERICAEAQHTIVPFLSDTPMLSTWYRLMGAKIDRFCELSGPKISVPDLVDIGPGVEMRRGVSIVSAAVHGGQLHLGLIFVGSGCILEPGSCVSAGTRLAPQTCVPAMSTTAGHLGGTAEASALTRSETQCARESKWINADLTQFNLWQDYLRIFVGMPWLATLFAVPFLFVCVLLDLAWVASEKYLPSNISWHIFWYIMLPVICTHGANVSLIAVVILNKRLIVGRLGPGKIIGPSRTLPNKSRLAIHWDTLRRWVHERCVTSHNFENALDPWVNTELLSYVHRFLGAKVGRRVQSDNFQAVDHDSIEIEDFVVFGSAVQIHCDTNCESDLGARELRSVRLLRLANCLDHAVVQPGTTVGEGAVLGTMTLAHKGSCFPPDSISTGAIGGRSVLLRLDASASAPAADRLMELSVMQQLDSNLRWTLFNVAQLCSSFILYVLPNMSWIIASHVVWNAYGVHDIGFDNLDNSNSNSLSVGTNESSTVRIEADILSLGISDVLSNYDSYVYVALSCTTIWISVYFVIDVMLLMLTVVLKWFLIGRYTEGNFAFFSSFHIRWAIMMNAKGSMSHLAESLQGTLFQAWYYRMMGARIGANTYIAGICLEYDLLEVGDGGAVNEECDTTAHTVERMVLKTAPVRVERGAAMLWGSVVMPGGCLEREALLLERSQVLKGDIVRAGEVWAGLPARRITSASSSATRAAAVAGGSAISKLGNSSSTSASAPARWRNVKHVNTEEAGFEV